MEKHKGPIMLVAALVLAGITTFVIYCWMQKQKPTPIRKVSRELLLPVVAAANDLHWGVKLSSENLDVIFLPEKCLPAGHFTSIEEIKDRVLKTDVVINEPILESKLAPEGSKAGLYGVIKDKKRAMSVKVNEVIGVAGFVYPGSNVDVLVTINQKIGKGPISKIILQDIPVLAAGTQMEVNEGEAVKVNVVTLEVTPEQSEKLAIAATKGKIRLALRRTGDVRTAATKGVTTSELISRTGLRKEAPKKRTPKKIGVVIKGSDISIRSL
ncbi:MAG: Flp pilus assembly protein CpaB [Thermodesulfobacteriota bacterium]|nr:Flp pilus assembly protein CpaB [Thermodesulfobacteriota bacterium]